MANRFVRNIKQVRDINQQPLNTNTQNDLLSDKNNRVYVRTGDRYEPITGLSEIKQRMNELDDNIKLLNPGKKQEKLLQSIEDEFNALKKRYDALTREIDNQNEEMEKIKLDMNGLNHQDDLNQINNDYDETIKGLQFKYDNEIKAIQNNIDELKENVNLLNSVSIERQLKRLNDELVLIKKYIENNKTDDVNNQSDNEINEINEIKASIQDIYSKIYELNESMKPTEPEEDNTYRQDLISELEKNIERLWGVVNTHQSDISDIANKVNNIRSDIANISKTLKTLDQYVKKSDTENWQKYRLTGNGGRRMVIPKEDFISLSRLGTGFFETIPSIEKPNQGTPKALNEKVIAIDIYEGTEGRRQYWLTDIATGELFFGSKDQDTFLGWQKLAFK